MTAGTRFRSVSDFAEITRTEPEKSLLEPMRKHGGRNAHGHLTARHRGGGHKRRYRRIDFRRSKFGIPAKVVSVEYDPNRTARIALLVYADGEKRYIIHPRGLRVGDTVTAGAESDIKTGNALPLKEIPLGTTVHCIELKPGRGAQLAPKRSPKTISGSAASEPWRLLSPSSKMARRDGIEWQSIRTANPKRSAARSMSSFSAR